MGNLNYMQAVPKIRKDFLKELLDILGKPTEVYLRAWHKQEKIDDIVLKEGYSERSCDCSTEKILKLYDDNILGRKKSRRYDIEKIIWHDFSKDEFCHGIDLGMEFTPYRIDLRINPGRVSTDKFFSLVSLINKYQVENNIKIVFPREIVKTGIEKDDAKT